MLESIAKGKTALMVIDMQNAFCHPDGVFARNGFDIRWVREIIDPIRRVIDACRERGIPVIYARLVTDPNRGGGRHSDFQPILKRSELHDGTWGTAILDDLRPTPDDTVVTKTRYSAFFGTSLDETLSRLKVDTLIFTGQGTNGCVESTIRDASYRDYNIVLVDDCTATWVPWLKEATLETVRFTFGFVVSSAELLAALGESARAQKDVK